jgi:hypothetical protein
VTTVPAVIDTLLAGLRTRPALSDVVISDGLPVENYAGRRLLTIGGQEAPTVEGTSEWGALGLSRRREDYVLRLYASATDGGVDQKAARDAAYAVVSEVGAFLREDPSLGFLVGEGAEMGSAFTLSQTSPDPDRTGEGRWAEVAFDVRVRARI